MSLAPTKATANAKRFVQARAPRYNDGLRGVSLKHPQHRV